MLQNRWNVWIAFFSALIAIAYGAIHYASARVTELTKDTFETFSVDAQMMPIEVQHRLMFSLIGLALALSGGHLAKSYLH